MRQREMLRPVFRASWDDLSHHFDAAELEAWSAAVLQLANVNAGPACLIAYWDASKDGAERGEIAPLLAAAQTAADICRHAGARAATSALRALPVAARAFGRAPELSRWWRVMDLLARQAAESVELVGARMNQILAPGTIDAFENFISAGLRAAAGNKARRIAFFSLEDELARRMIARDLGSVTFSETEIELKAFLTALWGRRPLLRGFSTGDNQMAQRRASIAGPLIRLPEVYRGVQGDAARALFRAAAAHAQAHLVLGQGPFPAGALKPLQIALVELIEDARIETLAMRQFPGLRRLWSPYYIATPSGVVAAPTLLARLARALFDPDYADVDAFVSKGRSMFRDAAVRIEDAAISREIGMLLGNDLGQMRVQFNVKSYVVEPIYRDDGLGLWDFGENAPPGEVVELPIEALRIEQREARDPGSTSGEIEGERTDIGGARPIAPDQRGVVIAKYPEWDSAHAIERPEWTVVREVVPRVGDPRLIEDALERAHVLRNRIRRLIRGVPIGRNIRLNREHEGHDLDIDAVLDAGIALRSGREPDPRVFRSSTSVYRDLSALLLIDTSESTRDRLTTGASILDVERLAVSILAEAMGKLGDPFSLLAFASDGREDVKMTGIKSFDEPYDRSCKARLAGLTSGLSTRLGAALRHAGCAIGSTASARKLIIVLTDGEPSDIDVTEPLMLVEDARRAAVGLHAAGIDAYGVVLGHAGASAASRIFGRGKTMMVHRVEDLPNRLSELYFRLARL
ncbi:MAG: VWA domain-containing protein [Bradyrhizobium sp.]|nr:VWA domain-containing protein [Bradyrhizobium sp.]